MTINTTIRRIAAAPLTLIGLALVIALVATPAAADQKFNDDVIVCGSLCVGIDCVNGESFGFDTIRLKENNLRIRFVDTSNTSSFPSNDWQLTANDSANGGANKFSIDDIDGARTPFTVEANARSNALYVESDGDIGIGTNNPVVDVHIVNGNTPTVRLEQDGSSGFTPQTWDLAGNEANFFLRDATNGSTLPIRVRPGAPSSAIDIAAGGDVGMGTDSPSQALHVKRTAASATAQILAEATGTSGTAQLQATSSGAAEVIATAGGSSDARLLLNAPTGQAARMVLSADNGDETWNNAALFNGNLAFNNGAGAGNEFLLSNTGTLTLTGSINTTDCSPCVSDYVFEPDYELMPLDELEEFVWREKHLPNVPSQTDIDKAGKLNMTQMQMRILEKVEEVVLYTIDQQKVIDGLTEEVQQKDAALSTLMERLARLEDHTGLADTQQ